MFTQQHYIAQAAQLKKFYAQAESMPEPARSERIQLLGEMVIAYVKLYEEDNPKFKSLLFIGACREPAK